MQRSFSSILVAITIALPTGAAAAPGSVERAAIDTYESACLSTPISEEGLAAWARDTGATQSPQQERHEFVIGHPIKVWRSAAAPHTIYVVLGQQLTCEVWFQTASPNSAREAFRRKVLSDIEKADPSEASVTVFRDGMVTPSVVRSK